jgi:hypothetical protein
VVDRDGSLLTLPELSGRDARGAAVTAALTIFNVRSRHRTTLVVREQVPLVRRGGQCGDGLAR